MKASKVVAGVVLSPIILLLALTLTVMALLVFKPGWLLNDTTLKMALSFAQSRGVVVDAEVLGLEVTSVTWREKRFEIHARKLAFGLSGATGEMADVRAVFHLDLLGRPVLLPVIGPIDLTDGRVDLAAGGQTLDRAEDGGDDPWDPETLLRTLAHTEVKPIQIRNLLVQSKGAGENPRVMRLDVTTQVKAQDVTLRVDLTTTQGPKVTFAAYGSLTKREASGQAPRDLRLDIVYRDGGRRIRANFQGTVSGRRFEIMPRVLIGGLPGGLEALSVDDCLIVGDVPVGRAKAGEVSTAGCTVALHRAPFVGERDFILPIPEKLAGRIKGRYAYDLNRASDAFEASFDLELEPVRTALYRFEGTSHLEASGRWSERDAMRLNVDMDTVVEVDRFKTLVDHLDSTDWAIPAPLNTLEGRIVCELQGRLEFASGTTHAPMACETGLRGGDQSLVTTAEGELQVEKVPGGYRPELSLEVVLEDVRVVLPDIRWREGVPALMPDKRFTDTLTQPDLRDPESGKARRKTLPLAFEIRVRTAGTPLRLVAKETKDPVPIDLDLTLDSRRGTSGEIMVRSFEVDIVKKPAKLDHFHMWLTPGEPIRIDGLAVVEQTELDILISVFGTTRSPKVDISSNPPRAESELMADLLYGRSMDALDTESQRSVAETRAAMADGALGLLSMFYLASTPIESVGYNPHTGEVSAKLKVREGVSLTVGSDFEGERRLGFTKRLRGNWSIETFAVRDEEAQGRGVAMLRWAKRY